MRPLLLIPLLGLLSACTWVHMAPGASAVRIVASPPASCEKRGEIEVAVKHSVAFIDRNAVYVTMRDEIVEMVGQTAYDLLVDHLETRRGHPQYLPHPALRRRATGDPTRTSR